MFKELFTEASDFAKSALKSARANIKRRKLPLKVKIKTLNKVNDIHLLTFTGGKLSNDDINDMRKWLEDDKIKITLIQSRTDGAIFDIEPK